MRIKSDFCKGLLLVLFLASTAFCEDSLIGYWLPAKISNGRMGQILEYRNDGTVVSYLTIMRDYNYTLEGNKLTLKATNEGESKQELLVNLKGDELTMKPLEKKDEGRTLKRFENHASSKAEGIMGVWVYNDPTTKGKAEYYVFTDDGFLHYRLPMPGSTVSRYVVKGNMLEISQEGMDPATMKWQIKDGILTLSSQDGKDFSYRRSSEVLTVRPN
jgi:hypothetical protein